MEYNCLLILTFAVDFDIYSESLNYLKTNLPLLESPKKQHTKGMKEEILPRLVSVMVNNALLFLFIN